MKRWAWVVIGLYAAALLALTWPVVFLAFGWGKNGLTAASAVEVFQEGAYWIWLAIMVAGQAALLAVPVRAAQGRPVARRPLALTVAASGLMAGALVLCLVVAYAVFINGDDAAPAGLWIAVGAGSLTWIGWGILFYRMGRRAEARGVLTVLCRRLVAGSILELLVAVPVHIWVRQRGECCAPLATFFGIAMGISVMLFAFGPSVFFLFVARRRRLHPEGAQRP